MWPGLMKAARIVTHPKRDAQSGAILTRQNLICNQRFGLQAKGTLPFQCCFLYYLGSERMNCAHRHRKKRTPAEAVATMASTHMHMPTRHGQANHHTYMLMPTPM